MSPEAQRIAIAEACGAKWRCVSCASHASLSFNESDYEANWEWCQKDSHRMCDDTIPNYPADLNAMHEAIGTLDFYSLLLCADWLIKICNPNHDRLVKEFTDHERARAINATAAQRAEAFLRTIGKWEDGK